MTNKKISELTSITGANVSDANDVLPIVDTSAATTKKITRAELFKSVSSVDINGGTIDGTTIGGSSASAGTFTTVTASGDLTIADKIVHDGDTNTAVRFPAADTVTVETAGSERMRIDSSGNVLCGSDGGGDIGSSTKRFKDLYLSGGVYLGGTGAANLLDDYEEGTWTPVVTPSSGAITSYTASGVYTKIGNLVTFGINIFVSDNGTGAGYIAATLPFTSAAVSAASGQNASTVNLIGGNIGPFATDFIIQKYDGTYPVATGQTLRLFGHYQV